MLWISTWKTGGAGKKCIADSDTLHSLPGGAVAAIVICVLLVVVGIIVVVKYCFVFKYHFDAKRMYLLDYSCRTMLV